MKTRLQNQKGFTIIEIMIVIVIMGILAAVAVPKIFDMIEKTNRTVDASTALEIRNILVREYTTATIQFNSLTCGSACGSSDTAKKQKLFVAVIVGKNGSKAVGGGYVLVMGKNWQDDKVAFERFENLMKTNGFTNLSVQCKNTKDGGWASYAVVLYGDGSTKIVSSEEEIQITTTGGDLENKISAMVAKSPTNIETFLGGKAN